MQSLRSLNFVVVVVVASAAAAAAAAAAVAVVVVKRYTSEKMLCVPLRKNMGRHGSRSCINFVRPSFSCSK